MKMSSPEAMSTLNTSLEKREFRRSKRLKFKEEALNSHRSVEEGALGYFELLPIEVIDLILGNFTVEELSVMTIVSKSMRGLIEETALRGAGLQKLLPKPLPQNTVSANHQARYMQHFHHLGLLMKRSTCLYATKERLKMIEKFIQQLGCLNTMSENLHSSIALTCYGKFIHTVIAGWDDVECQRAFVTVATSCNLFDKIGKCVTAKPGHDPHIEVFVRTFLHRVLLDQCNSIEERAFWLSRVLKPWPMVHQARVLYILYGPMCLGTDTILWYELTDSMTDSTLTATTQLAQLALALKILYNYKSEWNEDDIISVIEEITGLPDEWVTENTAKLLLLCGDVICTKVMGSKAINGRFLELARLIVSMSVVVTKEHYCMTWVCDVMKTLLQLIDNVKSRKVLLSAVAETFKDMILDFFEFHLDDSDIDASLENLLEAQAEFNKHVMAEAYQAVL